MEVLSMEKFPIAKNLLDLLQNNAMGEWLIDIFYNMLHSYALSIKNEKDRKKLDKYVEFVDKLRSLENEDLIKDQKDIADLEDILESI